VGDIPLPDGSLDFAFSLGVLHHVPDTLSAIKEVASKLKKGAPFLIYLYYALDNRPWWFRAVWKLSNICRIFICGLPASLRLVTSQLIAVAVYWPLARTAALVQRAGLPTALIPLEAYRNRSFYVMRTDAYDRFSAWKSALPGSRSNICSGTRVLRKSDFPSWFRSGALSV
jgi:SAM-dependent methyltransferase